MATATRERVVFEAATLKAALADVLKAVPARSAKPILQNVRLGDGLLTGTDLELRIDREVDYHGDPILLPAIRLAAILREVTGDVSIEPGGTSCKIKAGRGSWTIPTEDANEYPMAEVGELKPVCRLPADQYRRAVRATEYATDTSSSRFALGAILIDVVDSNPTFVATDGRRLAMVEAETDQDVGTIKCLLPARAALAATNAAGDSVQIETDGKVVVITSEGITVTGQLIAGAFPRWRDAVPDRNGTHPCTISREALMHGVRQAAIVTSEQSKGVEFTFGKSLKLTAQSSEAGQSSVTVELEDAGDAGTVKLDPTFVVDFVKTLDTDHPAEVTMSIGQRGDAVVLKCDDVTGVIMPLAE